MLSTTSNNENQQDRITAILSNFIKSPSLPTEHEATETFIRMFESKKAELGPKTVIKLIGASQDLSNYTILNYLIENIDKTLFNNVIKSPFTQFLHREMLKSSPDIKTMRGFINRFDIDLNYEIDSSGNTLLFLSLVKCPEVAKDLIKKGAEPNIINNKDSRKMTPLMEATATGFVELVNIMIIHGADVNAVDTEGFSSLHIAITNKGHQNLDAEKEKYDEIIQVLVQNRVNIFLSDTTRGCTPFMEATINGDIKTLQVLIDHVPAEQKYDMLNGKSRYNGGKTPLMVAINQDDLETAEFLINQEGIDVSVLADNDKDTALTELISSICTTPQTVENKKYTDVAMNLLHNIVTLLGPISKHQKSKLVKLAEQSGKNSELVTILKERVIVREKQKKFKTQSSAGASALDDSTGDDGLQQDIKEKKEYLDSLSKYDASLYEEHKDKLQDASIEQVENFFWQKLQQNLLNTDEQSIYNAALSNSATRETREIIYQELNDLRNEQMHRGMQFSNPTKILSFLEDFYAIQPNKSQQISMDDADIEIGMRRYYREVEKPKRNLSANIAEAKNDLTLMKQDLDQLLAPIKTENFSSKIASRNKLVSKSFKHDTNDILTWKKELDENKKLKSILYREEQRKKAKSSSYQWK